MRSILLLKLSNVTDCAENEYYCPTYNTCFIQCNFVKCPDILPDDVLCPGCKSDEFKCIKDNVCILKTAVCDGIFDCEDQTDEENCIGNNSIKIRSQFSNH